MAKKNQTTSKKRDQYTIVLEDVRSHMKALGEGQDALQKAVGDVQEEQAGEKESITMLQLGLNRVETRTNSIGTKVADIETDLSNVQVDIDEVKRGVQQIRNDQVTRIEFRYLEKRVVRLEKKAK